MPNGFTGKILNVDLSSGTLSTDEPGEEFYRQYLGGSAMAMHYVLKNTPVGADPLGPENVLALFTGILTGTAISGQSRLTSAARSPLTNAIGDAQSGGYFPAELKFAGFDGIVIQGESPKPVYLWVHHGDAELRDASHLWGKVTGEVENLLKEELEDKRIEVLQVGPAGENGVRYSALISMSNRANGRTGMGAVMGKKKLKAIAVRGKQKPGVFDATAFKKLQKWGPNHFPESDTAGLGKFGTPEVTAPQHHSGGLPTYNFNSGVFDDYEQIGGETLYDKHLRGHEKKDQDRFGRDTCYSCTIRCKRVAEVKEGPFKTDHIYGGPEYETIATFGSYCGVNDMKAIIRANALCNMYGMDTISCGATISWAMESWKEGKLTSEDTGGLSLKYGDAEIMVKLVEMIAKREGFGNLLAEGSQRAAERIGRGTENFLITSKGQEAPAHMPQVKRSLSVIYATNPFGADHMSSEHDPSYKSYPDRMSYIGLNSPQKKLVLNEEIMRFASVTKRLYSALDSVNVCQFVFGPAWQLYGSDQLVDLINAVTGWGITVEELLEVGERRLNMMRLYNAREGIGKESDTLSKKMFEKPLKGGRSDGYHIDRQEWSLALDEYYRLNEWDVETGYPKREKIENLGLSWVVNENPELSSVLS